MSADEAVHDAHEALDIKTAVKEISAARRSLDIEVGANSMTEEYEKLCRRYARTLRVPGFRAGKVPLHIIKQRFGREVEKEVVEHAMQHALRQGLAGLTPRPLGTPSLRQYDYSLGGALTFTVEYEVMPRIEVAGVSAIKVSVETPAVTDRMVGEALEELRERAARLVPVSGRGVHQGDHVVIDASGFDPDGAQLFTRENMLIEIGSNGPHPELTDPMRDMMPGEARTFTIDYPGDHPSEEMAGRRVEYRVTVREIKEKVLPELDDEFARELKLDALDELKRRVGDDLMARERRRTKEQARRAAVDQLLEHNPGVPAPEVLVDAEVDRRLQEVARSLRMQGIDPSGAAVDWDDIRQKQRDPAARTVRAGLLLDAIADERKISLEPGALDAAITDEAKRREQTPESLRAQLTKDGRLETLSAHLVREKVLDFLVGPANT